MPQMRVTLESLQALGACKEQVERFAAAFPDGAEVTRNNLAAALAAGLDLRWFGQRTFGESFDAALSTAYRALYAQVARANQMWLAAQDLGESDEADEMAAEAEAAYKAATLAAERSHHGVIDAILSLA